MKKRTTFPRVEFTNREMLDRILLEIRQLEEGVRGLGRNRSLLARVARVFLPPPFPPRTLFWIVLLVVVGCLLARCFR